MLQTRELMQNSLCKTLIDSHVAAIVIAVLIFSALDAAFMGLWIPAFNIALTLLTSVATGIPPTLPSFDNATRVLLPSTFSLLFVSLVYLLTAWILSRWVYGVGPIHSLGSYRTKLSRKTHV